ncbi:unnamed protein product [Blepharisma stoltei]|uniref:Uncharacterized protein n=1 Tax=Blepharisma stoltei TaxID=1481888 RepID=A0AAU9IHZ9_9CILI|nr:unnamed protein product [Blepharisma stoltei]
MESTFLKRFHGRIISMYTPDLLEYSVPVDKTLKPSQLYSKTPIIKNPNYKNASQHPIKPKSTKNPPNLDIDILPKIKIRSFSPYPTSNISENPFKNKALKPKSPEVLQDQKNKFSKIINRPSLDYKKRYEKLNKTYDINLDFSPLEKSKILKKEFELATSEPHQIQSPLSKNPRNRSPTFSDYNSKSENEGSQPFKLEALNGYNKIKPKKLIGLPL